MPVPQLAAALLAAVLLSVSTQWPAASATRHLTPVHVVFLTDCTMYSNWQSIGDTFSFRMSGQPGTVSRVMCCTPEEKAKYDTSLKSEVETWTAPSMAIHPRTGDHYAPYNKPEAVIDWLEHVTPKEEYVVVLDSDMVLRRPFLVEDMKPSPGWAIGARYTYMIGVNNELADRHIPEIDRRNDTFAGPFGRRADQVGGFFFIHRDDLKRMSPGWLKFSEDVRADPEAWRLTGDVYSTHKGDKPWISEMYGYAFSAAKAGVWHHWDAVSMIYPMYEPVGVPKVMHYGLLFDVDGYKFDKHWHYDFDVTKCPPWDLSGSKTVAGVFAAPPHPNKLKTKTDRASTSQYYRDLLAVETVATLNAAFCDYHLRHCPPSQQLLDVCTEAAQLYMDVMAAVDEAEKHFHCNNRHTKCDQWAAAGECEHNSNYMTEQCPLACKVCHSQSEQAPRDKPTIMLDNLAKLKAQLGGGRGGGDGGSNPTVTTTAQHKTKDPDGAVDPDANKVQPLPHTDVRPVQSPPPAQAPAVRSHSVTEQVQRQAQRAQKQAAVAGGGGGAGGGRVRKDLVIRCYRQSLSQAEVKECVAAANRGEEWSRPALAVAVDAEAVVTERASDLRRLHEEEAGSGAQVDDEEEDDGTLIKAADQTQKPAASGSVVAWLAALGTLQAVSLWGLVVLALLVVVPRVVRRLRRRPRSGMRSE